MRLIFGALAVLAAVAQAPVPRAVLAGYAVMPAETQAPGPPSGAFLPNGTRAGTPAFRAQPLQGFSSIWPDADGWFWALADNGYGTKLNSPDFLLRIYRVRPVFTERRVDIDARFVQLRDPDRRVRFLLVNEGTSERLLTGADFDPESLVKSDDGTFWVGDEFGPFLLHVAADGRVLDPPVEAPGVRSPDNPFLAPPDAGEASRATVGRSRGFEGLARADSHGRLIALLEGGVAGDAPGQTRAWEFDSGTKQFTGRSWRFPFEEKGHAVTELVAWGADFLTIERDNRQGAEARVKKVFALRFPERPEDVVEKRMVLDLLDIEDPGHLATTNRRFIFPFITTEALWPTADGTIVLVNDNNYPSTGGRAADTKDETEFIRVKLPR